ncbi:MAG: PD-(D/E)XK nuclease family protein, partial [Chthoniobacterales bacterium]
HGIPHFDAMGQLLPRIFESDAFIAWLELQRTPRLGSLLRFLNALESEHPLFGGISRQRVEKTLRRALGEIALDDLAVLRAHCGTRGSEAAQAVHALLGELDFLPARETLSEFLRATSGAFHKLQWQERWREIESRSGWTGAVEPVFSRTLFLRWLGEIASTLRVTRDETGSHPYARVQIVTPAQAEDQSWSYLILAGLNEGVWPPAGAGDFVGAEQIEAFNSSVQKLNRAATRRGRQGEGHIAVRDGKALFLGLQQRRQLALAQFDGLIDSAELGVALTASVVQEAAPERVSNPSEFFSRIYHQHRGDILSQQTLRSLRDETEAWLHNCGLRRRDDVAASSEVKQTRVAYDARRDAGPSGEYDFALRTAPASIEPLSVSDVEALLKSPALVWMKRFLGVEGTEDPTYAWNATVGKWTHDWLASFGEGANAFVPFPGGAQMEEQIRAAAERTRAEVLMLCDAAGKPLPDWWQSGWENALCVAQALGSILGTADDWRWAAPEWVFEAHGIPVAAGRTLLIRGRADLLLAETSARPSSLEVPKLWVIDFKTGNKKLALRQSGTEEERRLRVLRLVLKGGALQLSLYAMAARESGARDVEVSLISPATRAATPQLKIDNLAGCADAFAELARMQQEGIFGMRGSIRGAFLFTPSYPLATLAIDGDVLTERWEKTHPDLPLDEEVPWW